MGVRYYYNHVDLNGDGQAESLVHVRWGEIGERTVRDYYAVLRFDGETYPDQFPGAPPLGEEVKGDAYLTGNQSAASGLALRGAGKRK